MSERSSRAQRAAAWLTRSYPLCAGVLVLLVTLACIVVQMCRANQEGTFVYPLDDPYIHLAMAKNFARHGVFGVTADGFSSSTSSPLWTLGLGVLFFLTGVHALTPLCVNVVLGVAVLVVVDRAVAAARGDAAWRVMVLAAVVLLTPMPVLILSGMEHVLQLLLTLLFVQAAAGWLAGDALRPPSRVLALAALVAAVRYEGAFLVASVCLMALVRRRWRGGLALGASGAAPVLLYGMVSVAKGSMFLPSSVALKGHFPDFRTLDGALHALGYEAIEQLRGAPHLSGLIVAALVVYALRARSRAFWDPLQVSMMILFATTMLQVQFAGTGWFFRYEAYLVGLSLYVLALAACDVSGSLPRLALGAAVLLGAAPALFERAKESLEQLPKGSNNVYGQQVQMARFVARYYRGAHVAANDVGAIDFLADIHLLDIVGLASVDVARLTREERYDTAALSRLAKEQEIDIAVAYADSVVTIPLPSDWVTVGHWTIPHRTTCASDTVSFLAVRPEEASSLAAHLREFASELPAEVTQEVTLR